MKDFHWVIVGAAIVALATLSRSALRNWVGLTSI
jgi:hypothetical protein